MRAGRMNNARTRHYPLLEGLEGGGAAPIKECNATLKWGAAGEVKRLLQQEIDLPRLAESNVALHLFDRLADPSFEEGIVPCCTVFDSFTRFKQQPAPAGAAQI